jgi:hypothetical protein
MCLLSHSTPRMPHCLHYPVLSPVGVAIMIQCRRSRRINTRPSIVGRHRTLHIPPNVDMEALGCISQAGGREKQVVAKRLLRISTSLHSVQRRSRHRPDISGLIPSVARRMLRQLEGHNARQRPVKSSERIIEMGGGGSLLRQGLVPSTTPTSLHNPSTRGVSNRVIPPEPRPFPNRFNVQHLQLITEPCTPSPETTHTARDEMQQAQTHR